MKIKQLIGFVLLAAMAYGLWTKMRQGMSSFRVEDSLFIFFIVFTVGSILFFGIRKILRS